LCADTAHLDIATKRSGVDHFHDSWHENFHISRLLLCSHCSVHWSARSLLLINIQGKRHEEREGSAARSKPSARSSLLTKGTWYLLLYHHQSHKRNREVMIQIKKRIDKYKDMCCTFPKN
jgi:hypothetical protein